MNETFELLNAIELLCKGEKKEALERIEVVRQHYNFDDLEPVEKGPTDELCSCLTPEQAELGSDICAKCGKPVEKGPGSRAD